MDNCIPLDILKKFVEAGAAEYSFLPDRRIYFFWSDVSGEKSYMGRYSPTSGSFFFCNPMIPIEHLTIMDGEKFVKVTMAGDMNEKARYI